MSFTLALKVRKTDVVSIENAAMKHVVGRAWFGGEVPAIRDSSDCYVMVDEMRKILAIESTDEITNNLQFRIRGFLKDHGIKE